jgi:hypothetical protein
MTSPTENEGQEKPKVSLLDVLRHLVQHSGGYATTADRDAHVAALEEMAGDAVPDEGVEVPAPATAPAVAEPEDPRDVELRQLRAELDRRDMEAKQAKTDPEPVSGPVESATITPDVHGDDGQAAATENTVV